MYIEIRKVSSMPVAPYAARTLYLVSGSNNILHVLLTSDDGSVIYRSMNTTDISSVVTTTITLLRNAPDGLAGLDSSGELMQVPQTANRWTSAITLAITGLLNGSASIDGSSSVTIEIDNLHSPIYTYVDGSISRIDMSDGSYKLYTYTASGDIDSIIHVQDKYVYKKVFNYNGSNEVISIPRLTYSPDSIVYTDATTYDFTTPSLSADFTFTRTGNVTYTASTGYEAVATSNTPIFDYDFTTLKCKGLLIQKPITNIIKYSNDFSNAVWTKNNVTIAATNYLLSTDNTTYLTLLNTTAAANSLHRVNQTFSATSGDLVTFTVVLQTYGYPSAYIILGPEGVSSGFNTCGIYVDLLNGVITNIGVGVVYSYLEKKANNCYLVSVAGYANITSSTLDVNVYTSSGLTSGITYTADSIRGILIGQTQLSIGQEIRHTIVPNNTNLDYSASGDSCIIQGSNYTSRVGSLATIILDMDFIGVSSAGTDCMLSIDDATAANRVQVRRKSNTEVTLFISQSSVTQTYSATIPTSTSAKIVLVYSRGYVRLWCNGYFIADSYDISISPTRLQIGGGVGSTYCSAWVKRLDIFKNVILNPKMVLKYYTYTEPVAPTIDYNSDYTSTALPVTIDSTNYTNNITTKGAIVLSFTSSSFTPSVSNCIVSIDDTTIKHVIQVSRTTATQAHIRVRGSLGSIDDYVTIESSMVSKICIAWQPGMVVIYINGVLLKKIPGLILKANRIQFATGIGLSPSIGVLGKVVIYKDEIVSDVRAQFLSQWISEYTEPATPSPTKTLTLTSGVAASELSVVRNFSVQTYNSSGYSTTVAANTAIIAYDYPSLVCRGMLVTRSTKSTQCFTKDYNSSDWTIKINILSSTINSGLGSDNTNSLTRLVPNTTNSFHYVSRPWAIGNNELATFRLRIKAHQLGIIKLEYLHSSALCYVFFNCFTKQLSAVGSGVASASFIEEANSTFLVTMTLNAMVGGYGDHIAIFIRDNNNVLSYAGNGTDGIYLGELQCSNNTYSSIYPLLSENSPRVYRANGRALLTGSQFTSNLHNTKAAVYCEFDSITYFTDIQGIISLHSLDDKYVAQIARKSNTTITIILNTPTFSISQDIVVASSTTTKAFITYMPGYIGFFYNGALLYEKYLVNMYFEELQLGGGPGIENSYGYIRQVKLYKDTYVTPAAGLLLSV